MIKFAPARPEAGEQLDVVSEELFVYHIHKAFGQFPVELDKNNIERLAGIGATYVEPNPLTTLIRAIRLIGTIKVWRE